MFALYITHPQVRIDPDVPVPQWGLSETGAARARRAAALPWARQLQRIVSSDETKAIETAEHFFREDAGRPAFIWTTGAWLIWDHLATQAPDKVHRLEAAIARPVYYELAEIALEEGDTPPGLWSDGVFFPLATA